MNIPTKADPLSLILPPDVYTRLKLPRPGNLNDIFKGITPAEKKEIFANIKELRDTIGHVEAALKV